MDKKHIKELMDAIEQLRQELHQIAAGKEFHQDRRILEKSQELDKMLAEYYRLLKKRKIVINYFQLLSRVFLD
ncbi:aspartyl-phosphate phosphatase Spo0E family protein [Halothermothrix orenii]|uniref:aspartyl-phosphate phosphatase Spo0E family protein n=1 Tax=Halothermothrix orenii TaxID=31909 RepID=UPI0002D3A18F|nr:aspartyl-phosphate phosphatase Spo0E family protein [Halothermothrix orenii]